MVISFLKPVGCVPWAGERAVRGGPTLERKKSWAQQGENRILYFYLSVLHRERQRSVLQLPQVLGHGEVKERRLDQHSFPWDHLVYSSSFTLIRTWHFTLAALDGISDDLEQPGIFYTHSPCTFHRNEHVRFCLLFGKGGIFIFCFVKTVFKTYEFLHVSNRRHLGLGKIKGRENTKKYICWCYRRCLKNRASNPYVFRHLCRGWFTIATSLTTLGLFVCLFI